MVLVRPCNGPRSALLGRRIACPSCLVWSRKRQCLVRLRVGAGSKGMIRNKNKHTLLCLLPWARPPPPPPISASDCIRHCRHAAQVAFAPPSCPPVTSAPCPLVLLAEKTKYFLVRMQEGAAYEGMMRNKNGLTLSCLHGPLHLDRHQSWPVTPSLPPQRCVASPPHSYVLLDAPQCLQPKDIAKIRILVSCRYFNFVFFIFCMLRI